MLVGSRIRDQSEAQMISDVRMAVTQLTQSELDPSAWWTGASASDLIAFRNRIRAEIGPASVESVTITSTEFGVPTAVQFRVLLESDSAQRIASIDAELAGDPSTWLPRIRLKSMVIAPSDESGAKPIEFPVAN
ncbi:MAG: hypothetical protein O3B75_09740 [Planctomycetota bacterium]|nr:hypothetical protein [Planctomycetota bacterium]